MDIARLRVANQQLLGTTFTAPEEIVRWFGAVQAQEYDLSKWALGLRQPRLRDQEVEQAFTEGRILRTHLLRPTWHFVAPEDIRWMLLLTAPQVQAANAYMYRQTGLDRQTLARSSQLINRALEGDKRLTRPQIGEFLRRHRLLAEGMRLSYMVMHAELEGIVCSGGREGKQFTYALLEERVPPVPAILREEALYQLTERYFRSRGPALAVDFSTWSGLAMKDVAAGIGMMGSSLESEVQGGKTYYHLPEGSPYRVKASCWLLPTYDELIMGYKHRDAILPPGELMSKALFDNMILYRDQIAGTWRRKVVGKGIELDYQLFKPDRLMAKALDEAIARLATFIGLRLSSVVNRGESLGKG